MSLEPLRIIPVGYERQVKGFRDGGVRLVIIGRPQPTRNDDKVRPIDTLAEMFDNMFFRIPDGDYLIKAESPGTQLHGDIVRVAVRDVPQQDFIANGQ